jgi:hypothetical protein
MLACLVLHPSTRQPAARPSSVARRAIRPRKVSEASLTAENTRVEANDVAITQEQPHGVPAVPTKNGPTWLAVLLGMPALYIIVTIVAKISKGKTCFFIVDTGLNSASC